jgi:hypothetical protein
VFSGLIYPRFEIVIVDEPHQEGYSGFSSFRAYSKM